MGIKIVEFGSDLKNYALELSQIIKYPISLRYNGSLILRGKLRERSYQYL